jgi:prepilin-type N-terminal cleavage/methylation domain-containing protein/prepilin-type processing-associated H-X9-DG protein
VKFDTTTKWLGSRRGETAGRSCRSLKRRGIGLRLFRGFTLVELLIVLTVIGALATLLLPAIQAVRESARRTQCASQIRQIAFATLNYESAHKLLPSAGLVKLRHDDERNLDIVNPFDGVQLSWVVPLLPHLEQAKLAAQFDDATPIFFQTGDPQAALLPILTCPSDGSEHRFYDYPTGKRFAKGNYAAYASPFHVDLQLLYHGALIVGGQPLSAIEDGTTSTLAFAEVRTLEDGHDERGAWALPWCGASLLAFDMHPVGWYVDHNATGEGDEYHAEMNARYDASSESLGETQRPNNQGPNVDTLISCQGSLKQLAADEGMPCTMSKVKPGLRGYMSAAPRSLHPGGVNGAWLDGHVTFLSDDIDEIAMAYHVSINDGRVESR